MQSQLQKEKPTSDQVPSIERSSTPTAAEEFADAAEKLIWINTQIFQRRALLRVAFDTYVDTLIGSNKEFTHEDALENLTTHGDILWRFYEKKAHYERQIANTRS